MSRLAKLEKLLALDGRDTFVLYALAQEHGTAGDHGRAIEFYDRTLAVDPTYCYAYFHKARCQQQVGAIGPARETVRDGIAAAHRAADSKALNELSGLAVELAES
ncbi:MAG: hypothetical protein ACT4PL_03750 [Phycisphaerales bacterium]